MTVTDLTTTLAAKRTKPTGWIGRDLLASEWTKLRTLRSTYWTLAAAAAITIGIGAIACAVLAAQYDKLSAADRADLNPASFSLTGGILAQLAIAVLGVLVITGEYGSGTIHTTFASAPQRLAVLAAKSAVFAVTTFAVTIAACFTAFFAGQAILASKGIDVGIGAPNALRTVIGCALYLTVLGLLALGIGTLIRKTAGAITAVVGMIFVLPALSALLPSSMSDVQMYLPGSAGEAIINGGGSSRVESLSPWVGFGVFCLYAIVALGAAGYALVHRDA